MPCRKRWLLLAVVCWLMQPALAPAYVDMAPTLARILRESQAITLAEVDRFSLEKGAVVLKKVRDLKGQTAADSLKHLLVRAGDTGIDGPLLEWAEPGNRCVIFVTGKSAVVCVGEGWYQVQEGEDGWWRIGAPRPDLPLAYYGPASRLAEAVPLLLAGRNVVITTLPHGAELEGASFDLALNRADLPGLVKVQRLRASQRMPPMAMGVGQNPALVLGPGRAAPEDVSALRERLRSSDASVRAESAADLGSLGRSAAAAAPDLTKMLDDKDARVRLTAASALLRIAPTETPAAEVLAKGLASEDAHIRRQAARAVGLAGPAAAPLASKLGALLSDPDPLVRRTALQAVATLGPVAAGSREAVTKLLSQRETAVSAADALGRMGLAARPSLKALAPLLSAESPAERWAAVRAMAQIGGPDAAPAVEFLTGRLQGATQVDGYNILIYLALLGPVAKDAVAAVRSSPVRNPVLRQTTAWAIDPGDELLGLGPLGNAEFAQYIMTAYIRELGDHLRPVAQSLARKIMAGTAGDVPLWGYKLLARYPDDSLAIFTPGLAEKELTVRERAAVALGYMGRAAAPAAAETARAAQRATDEREQRLLLWCLRQIKEGGP